MIYCIIIIWFIVALATMAFISGAYNRDIAVDEKDEIPYYMSITIGLFWPCILPVFLFQCTIKTLARLTNKK